MRSTGRMWEYNLIASIKSRRKGTINLQCGAPDFAKLVCNSNTWGFMADLCISNGASKPTHRTGGTSWDFQYFHRPQVISRDISWGEIITTNYEVLANFAIPVKRSWISGGFWEMFFSPMFLGCLEAPKAMSLVFGALGVIDVMSWHCFQLRVDGFMH